MATLAVEVTVAKGAHSSLVAIDGMVVHLDPLGQGTAAVAGSCGDGSQHMLIAGFEGPVGATMAVAVTCAGATVCEIKAITITASREPFGGTHRSFKL